MVKDRSTRWHAQNLRNSSGSIEPTRAKPRLHGQDIRKIGQLSLETVGKFAFIAAASALDGLQAASADRPHLILMDVMMPGMDGLSALAELQRSPTLRDIPVVFLTAKVQRSKIADYLSLGAAAVIPKPFDPMTLASQVRAFLKHARHAVSS